MGWKLVRDKIPEIIEADGRRCKYHIVTDLDDQFWYLHRKMDEELGEFTYHPCVEEAADMYEVLRGLCALQGIDMQDVLTAADKKRDERGGFEGGVVLEEVIYEKSS